MSYPVTFEADYVEKRSRLTTFFRFIVAIPHLIVGAVYGFLAFWAIVFAWFAIVFTGRYPEGLYNFVAGFNRFFARLGGYLLLMTDKYPPFWGEPDDSYPIRMHFAGPLPSYSRAKTGFRAILGIPIMFMRYALQALLEVGAVGAWVVIVITGKQPRGLQDVLELGMAYTARSDSYLWLLTETYPPFQVDRALLEPGSTGAAIPPPPQGQPTQQPPTPQG